MGDRVLWAFRHDLPGESDEQLTDRARNGDKSAFGELYRRHRKAAESTAWCLLRSKSDADDVVADAFAGVLSALRNGRGPRDNFRGYLLACVRNGCRSRRKPTVLVDENQLERWNPALEDPERYVEADTVARAFASLAPRWQNTLWMTEVEQLAPAEVCERLELSPNAAAALTHRARQAFAAAYLAEHVSAATGKECQRVAGYLPGYVRNQLRDLQLATVERHIVNCQSCAAAVDDLRDVNGSLRSLMPLAPPVLTAAAAATDASLVATTVGGGLTLGLPSTGLVLKGLVAVLLVAPILSTDSPFSSARDGDARGDIASAATVSAPETSTGEASADPAPDTAAPEPTVSTPEVVASTVPDEPESTAALLAPTTELATVTLPQVSTAIPLIPAVPATASLGSEVDDVVDGLVSETVDPLLGNVTEPVVETLDEALAMMGLGSTGETVALLRTFVPVLNGPLFGDVVDALLDLTSIGTLDTTQPDGGGVNDDELPGVTLPGAGSPLPGITIPAGTPASGSPSATESPIAVPSISVPLVTVPSITTPAITTPDSTVPSITVPAIEIQITSLPPITLPIVDLPPITVPAISLSPITIPDLLG